MNISLITRDGCSFCVKAKTLLQHADLKYTERKIGVDITRDDVLKTYPGVKLLPLVVVDNNYIGSYDELYEFVNTFLNTPA